MSAHVAAHPSPRLRTTARRLLLLATLCASLLVGAQPGLVAAKISWLAPEIPPMAAEQGSEAWMVLTKAELQLRDRWMFSAIGPDRFDCSGLVFFAFRETGLLDRVGSKRRGATAYMSWFAKQGWRVGPNIENAQAGDLLVWGGGKHMGLYLGDGWAISALVNPFGVRIHRYDRVNLKLTDILKVPLSRKADGSDPYLTPTAAPEAPPTVSPEIPSATLPIAPIEIPAAPATAIPST